MTSAAPLTQPVDVLEQADLRAELGANCHWDCTHLVLRRGEAAARVMARGDWESHKLLQELNAYAQPALKDAPGWYFRKGVERRRLALSVRDVTGEDAVKVADAVKDAVKAAAAAADEEAGPLMMEDVSRLVSESLQHCPPEKSRVIAVSAAADGEAAISKVTENEEYFAKLLASV